MKGKLYIDPVQPKNLREEEVIIFQITDQMRIQWLLKNGYLPRFIGAIAPEFETEALEWAFRNGNAPAYWRPAKPGETPHGAAYHNRVVDKPCDRDRIDRFILEARKLRGSEDSPTLRKLEGRP